MNTNFDPFIESKIFVTHREDLPKRLTGRFQRIFTAAFNNEGTRSSNYQTLMALGELAVVTGLVGTVASYYFQTAQYLPGCLGNIVIGAVAMQRGLRG